MRFRITVVIFLAMLPLGVAASADTTQCTFKVSRDFRNIQSQTYRHSASTSDVIDLLFETEDSLVRNDAISNTVLPGLASVWEYLPATNSFVFTLNQNCKWSDGSPLIADDFVYGFRELYSHGVAPIVGGHLIAGAEEIIEKGAPLEALQVKALSDDTVTISVIGDPSVALKYLTYVSYSPLPSHVLNAEHISMASPRRLTIGPFSVILVARDLIVLEKNPYYCSRQEISLDRIELINRRKGYWEFSEFMAGRLDMVRYAPEKQLQLLQNHVAESSHARVELVDEKRQTYLILNPLHSGFANAEIRKKLFAAIDYASLVDRGNAISKVRRIATTLFYDLPSYENYQYTISPSSFEQGIAELRTTMEKYGYSNKNRLKASIRTYPLERFETIAKMLASMLSQAHFDITFVKAQSVAEVVEDSLAGRYELFFASWYLDYSDPQSSLDGLLQSAGYLLNQENPIAANTELTEQFINPMKAMLMQLKENRQESDRFEKLHSIEKLIVESGLIIPIYTEQTAIIVASRISPLNGQFPHTRVLSLTDCDQETKMR